MATLDTGASGTPRKMPIYACHTYEGEEILTQVDGYTFIKLLLALPAHHRGQVEYCDVAPLRPRLHGFLHQLAVCYVPSEVLHSDGGRCLVGRSMREDLDFCITGHMSIRACVKNGDAIQGPTIESFSS